MKKLKPTDYRGREIHKDDWVRIIELPPWVAKMPNETKTIFKKALNKTFKVEGFDKQSFLELEVWRKLKIKTMDTVWIEPNCVIRSRLMKRI